MTAAPTPRFTRVRLAPRIAMSGKVRAPPKVASRCRAWVRSRSTPIRPPASAATSSRRKAPARVVSGSNSSLTLLPAQAGKEGNDDRHGDESDDDPFQDFHPARGGLGRHFLVDAFGGLQF